MGIHLKVAVPRHGVKARWDGIWPLLSSWLCSPCCSTLLPTLPFPAQALLLFLQLLQQWLSHSPLPWRSLTQLLVTLLRATACLSQPRGSLLRPPLQGSVFRPAPVIQWGTKQLQPPCSCSLGWSGEMLSNIGAHSTNIYLQVLDNPLRGK